MTLIMLKPSFIFSALFLLLLTFINTSHAQEITNHEFESDETWSQCNCPPPSSSSSSTSNNHAKMAYLISVHNRRTIHDAAYLLKSLMETSSQRGTTAVILIHVDHRVGIANPATVAKNATDKNQFLYWESPLRRYVDACLANSCARGNNSARNNIHQTNADDNVLLEVHSHFEPKWGQWSMNEPTLWAMEYLLYHRQFQRNHNNHNLRHNDNTQQTSPPPWDVFINLSGDTLPVISSQRISQLFNPINGPLGNTNFVTSSSCATGLLPTSIFDFPKGTMKRSHYFQHDIPKRLTYIDTLSGEWKHNVETPIYFGSQWMALTHDFVQFIIRSMSHPNGMGNVLKETLVDCGVLMTDESFFATMLMNSPFKDTVPKLTDDEKKSLVGYPSMRALRYERMDENAPNAWGRWTNSDSFYDIPPKFKGVTDGEGPSKPWGPYFLGLYDLGGIKESGAIFIRKVSWSVDENLVRLLPVVLSSEEKRGELLEWDVLPDFQWPVNGVMVHDPFVWREEEEEGEEAKE